jgi:hypothetical protein
MMLMELVSLATDSISEGDIVESLARLRMSSDLLPLAAVFCSFLPGKLMAVN